MNTPRTLATIFLFGLVSVVASVGCSSADDEDSDSGTGALTPKGNKGTESGPTCEAVKPEPDPLAIISGKKKRTPPDQLTIGKPYETSGWTITPSIETQHNVANIEAISKSSKLRFRAEERAGRTYLRNSSDGVDIRCYEERSTKSTIGYELTCTGGLRVTTQNEANSDIWHTQTFKEGDASYEVSVVRSLGESEEPADDVYFSVKLNSNPNQPEALAWNNAGVSVDSKFSVQVPDGKNGWKSLTTCSFKKAKK